MMMNQKQKCSLKDHEAIEAIIYCQECKVNFCKTCENFHSKIFKNHHLYKTDEDIKNIFTGFCTEKNHLEKLEFFCEDHNQLCCSSCIIKVKRDGKGQHTNCNICNIEDIKEKKMNKLKENIEILEKLSNSIDQSINELKINYEKISEKKEEAKLEIQKIFTKIRNQLNEREDELLKEIEIKFENLYFKADIIKKSEKLPKKIKVSLDKGRIIENELNELNELSSLINNCLNIENNIKDINLLFDNIKKCKNEINLIIKFNDKEDNTINNLLDNIKTLGIIDYNHYKNNFKFKVCPESLNDRKYEIKEGNIITYIGKKELTTAIICENKLENNKEYKWKIKILKSKNKYINVGVAPIDIDITKKEPYKYGWYLFCHDSTLYSGPPYNYVKKETNLKKVKEEIIIVLDMSKRTIKFIIDNEDKGESYTNIPIEKPLTPV